MPEFLKKYKFCFSYHFIFQLVLLIIIFHSSISCSFSQSIKINKENFSIEYPKPNELSENTIYMPDYNQIKPTIALALSGGGSRGLSQIGVIDVLLKEGIEPDYIVGTSIGAFVGGLIASGYSPEELYSIALNTNWDDFFELNTDKTRSEYFVDQKLIYDRSLLRLRFNNFRLVIPEGITEGNSFQLYNQKLFLSSIYQTTGSFDKLKYKFRAVATDIAQGKSVSLDRGNIISAIRASATFPLRNSTVRIDSMILVDGGLFANLPTKAARSLKPDLVIAVDNISPLHPTVNINNAWVIADQVVSVLMKNFSDSSRKYADFIISPKIGNKINTDFTDLDSLFSLGRKSAENIITDIKQSLFLKQSEKIKEILPFDYKNRLINKSSISSDFKDILDEIFLQWDKFFKVDDQIPFNQLMNLIYLIERKNERYYNLFLMMHPDGKVNISGTEIPYIRSLDIVQSKININRFDSTFEKEYSELRLNSRNLKRICEKILHFYRENDYPFASISDIEWDSKSGHLTVRCTEGLVSDIIFSGNKSISDYLIRRELNFRENQLLRTDEILASWENLVSSDIIENSNITFNKSKDDSTYTASINVTEEPDQLVSVGIFLDNERYMQAGLDLIQSNIVNSGLRANYRIAGGLRNFLTSINLTQQRFLNTMITASISAYYKKQDLHIFSIDTKSIINRYKTSIAYEATEESLGFIASGGYRLTRNSIFSGEYRYENQRYYLSSETKKESYTNINTLKFSLIFDNENSYGFPTKGRSVNMYLESSLLQSTDTKSFSKIFISYKSNLSTGVHTFRPIFYFGFADKTLPRNEFFNLGGMESFYGLSENEERGRQIFKGSIEYQLKLPFDILFDSFLTFRYDLGSVWEIPETIKFESLKHGIGTSLGINTPIGPAKIAVGEMFYFQKSPNIIIYGYPHLYFSIGVNI